MTDQKPTGVFVRLHEGQLREDQIAKICNPKRTMTESLLAIGTPVQARELPVITTLGTLRNPVPCVRHSDAQAQIAARDAQIREYRMLLDRIINKASLSCFRTLSGRDSRLLASACADAREALKGGAA